MAALSDMFAAASLGTYPTPTPSAAQRAAYAVSYGLLGVLPTSGERLFGEFFFGMHMYCGLEET